MQQIGGYLGYTGRAANVIAKAALDPEPTFAGVTSCKTSGQQLFDSAEFCRVRTIGQATGKFTIYLIAAMSCSKRGALSVSPRPAK
jgi:hypothetical protein